MTHVTSSFDNRCRLLIPVLSHHPDLQVAIQRALDDVEKNADWRATMAAKATMIMPRRQPLIRQKGFALRGFLTEIRTTLHYYAEGPPPPKDKMPTTPSEKIDSKTAEKPELIPVPPTEVLPGKEIVQPRPEDKKPVEKKPEEKKPGAVETPDTRPPAAQPVLRGTVMGKVRFLRQPLPYGMVVLTLEDGDKAYYGSIHKDGSFAIDNIPVGRYRVTVTTVTLFPQKGVKPVVLPEKYTDVKLTPLVCVFDGGKQSMDLDLK